MTSIFSLCCAVCGGELQPRHGAVWSCERCGATFEVCGQVLVSVAPEEDSDDAGRRGHEPVDADGKTKILDGSSLTSQRSSSSSA
jgi:hypothetical protein